MPGRCSPGGEPAVGPGSFLGRRDLTQEKTLMSIHQRVAIKTLSVSLDPLVAHFNDHQDKTRFLAVLSPGCPL
jgi:hypothetical protein